ncbi:hypothetical protein ACHAW5_001636 [Stephanodiscus triporus]|uniref:Uncharacterized protein n=1 Tax=Stephanodiscus triporus TaxID=2934178 RepID=A0ABD3Q1X9_9STRA
MSSAEAPPTIMDENGNAPDAPTARMKVQVPRGDRRIVLSAIDNQINAAKIEWKEKNADEPPARVEFFVNCIERTGESLKRQIDSVTVDADEEIVEGALDSFRTRLLSTTRSSTSEDHDDGSLSSSSSVDDVDEEFEFEDDEIVDRDAHDHVKRLRAQAREVSSRVIAIREETMGRALDMTRRDLSELLRVHGFSEGADEQPEEGSDQVENANDKIMDSLNPMHAALQTLVSSLQNVDSALAEKLEALKDTIETIDSSVEKYQRLSQGDVSALSQMEKALLAIEHPEETAVHSLEEEAESHMNPDRKLARLLAGIL